jgi:hypothetical protein
LVFSTILLAALTAFLERAGNPGSRGPYFSWDNVFSVSAWWWASFLSRLIARSFGRVWRAARNGPDEKFSPERSEFLGRKVFGPSGLYPWPCAKRGAGHNVKAMGWRNGFE